MNKLIFSLFMLFGTSCASSPYLKTEQRKYKFNDKVQLVGFYEDCSAVIISQADGNTYFAEVTCVTKNNITTLRPVYVQLTDIKGDKNANK